MGAVLRAKMRVSEVNHRKDAEGNTELEVLKLEAVYSNDDESENKKWCKWTPFGKLELHISNPDAIGKVSSGHEFFVDLIPAE